MLCYHSNIKRLETLMLKRWDTSGAVPYFLQEKLKDFAAGGDNWFERAKGFVTDLNRIGCVLREGNIESQREYLEKIGSNFILKERRVIFSTEASFRPFFSISPYLNWRRVEDLNLWSPLELSRFRGVRNRPLCQLSGYVLALSFPVIDSMNISTSFGSSLFPA